MTRERRCLIFIGDVHSRHDRPHRRLDKPLDVIEQKFEWIAKRAIELEAVRVVLGGDLGHRHEWLSSHIGRMGRILGKFPLPPLIVPGNHDVPSYNYDHFQTDCGVGILDAFHSVEVLGSPSICGPFQLWPFRAGAPETDALVEGTWTPPDAPTKPMGKKTRGMKWNYSPDLCQVAVVHAPVGAVRTPSQKDYRELFIPFFDVALFADIHSGFPVHDSITGCTLANPGALYRDDAADIGRAPQIAIVWTDGTVAYETVPHSPAEDVFDMSGLTPEEKEEAQARSDKTFKALVAKVQLTRDQLNSKDFVERVGTGAGFSKEAITTLQEKLP